MKKIYSLLLFCLVAACAEVPQDEITKASQKPVGDKSSVESSTPSLVYTPPTKPQTSPAPTAKTAENKPPEQVASAPKLNVPPVDQPPPPYKPYLIEIYTSSSQDLATEYEAKEETIGDPLYGWNVGMYWFNDKLYFWLLKPVSIGWKYLIYPHGVRMGIHNVIENLGWPRRFVNCLFQARFAGSGIETSRFLINLTLGCLGTWDPAKDWFDLDPDDRDFDQTLGKYGIGMGCYITWPFVGPCSIRGTFGYIMDSLLNPVSYVTGGVALTTINNTSLDFNPYESLVNMSVDPYTGIRNAYLQNRRDKVEK
ncbi:MAG: MlaA family lipoprotein [Candidatus Sumerlaeota bacterium]|nr:MlaA family lipoprotein [Candidatus Sumerlaeota bacterium]